jgi:hypothetical protein
VVEIGANPLQLLMNGLPVGRPTVHRHAASMTRPGSAAEGPAQER